MASIDWQQSRRLPRYAGALFSALRLHRPDTHGLHRLTAGEWQRLLDFCDRSQLTLLLARVAGDAMPPPVRTRLRNDLERNRVRLVRVRNAYREIARTLESAGIPFAVLKGFTLSPDFCPDLESRVQYDIDLVTAPGDVLSVRDAVAGLGYEPLALGEDLPTDHLPAMIRKTGWEWRDDFFDPEIPISVDLHFRFWDESTERLRAPGLTGFWDRRTEVMLDGELIPCLQPVDALGYACLHLLRHLLRGSLKPVHVYELAYALDQRSEDEAFWARWQALHPEPLRRLEAVCFQLACAWFACRLAPAACEQVQGLPDSVLTWFGLHAAAPAEALFRPNKNELWLHLSLLETRRDRFSVLRRRLLPARLPGPVDAVYLPEQMLTRRIRVRRTMRYLGFLAGRAAHHLWALPSLLCEGVRWWWRSNALGAGFWTLLAGSSLFNLGMFVFVVLYNLYLLDRGLHAQAIGWINSAAIAGSIAGTLPAGLLARRFGLRTTVLLAFAAAALVSGLRAAVPWFGALVLFAFLSGAAFAVWAVSIAPAVACLTAEPRRTRAFSLLFSSSIALGIAGGWIGGHLPTWLAGLQPGASPLELKRAALLVGCGLAAVAVWPIARLKFQPDASAGRTVFPRGRFIARYLAAFGLWNLATGSFNPFFNVYFSTRFQAGAPIIGTLFSVAQLAQALTLLAAPYVLRRLGLLNGVAATMAATGAALACLAGAPALAAAGAAYTAYMAFQWMSEPGINTLLMNRVRPEQRGGASALNYLVAFSSQAIAAAVAGTLAARFGFHAVLLAASALALAASLAFRKIRGEAPSSRVDAESTPIAQSLPESAAGSVRR